jgi:DNA-directed RNA polymerase alpha subunit
MDLFKFYTYCLNDSDKRCLAELIKREKIKASTSLVLSEWINVIDGSVRLRNILRHISLDSDIYPSQVTKEMFFNMRGAGVKSWEEFTELRGDNL